MRSGCFEMTGDGIAEVADPSGLFLSRARQSVSGTCVTIAVEGRRALPVEMQALIVEDVRSDAATGRQRRRQLAGRDAARRARAARPHPELSTSDVYVSTVGGIRVTEPGADLAIALAIASAFKDRALPPTMAAIGEISLAGEMRPASSSKQRIAEAKRLGFRTILDARSEQIARALASAFAAPLPREVDAPAF